MANTKKCDICGILYEFYNVMSSDKPWNTLQLGNTDVHGNYYPIKRVDCCPKCHKIINDLIQKKEFYHE